MNQGTLAAIIGASLAAFGVIFVRQGARTFGDLGPILTIVGYLAIIFGLGLTIFGLRGRSYYGLPTFKEYKARHPDAVDGRGQVRCHACGDTRRRLWRLDPNSGPTRHICIQCGTPLYRS